jgi:DNA-binding transcriptional MocR family regulator
MHGPDGLTPTSVAVGLVMSEYADWATGGDIRPGRDRLAAVIGVSIATVTRSITALHTTGWITTDEVGTFGRTSVYRLTIPPLVIITTGEITTPITGSPVSHLPARNRLTSEPLRAAQNRRNRLTGDDITGSPVSHHLYQDLTHTPTPLGTAA